MIHEICVPPTEDIIAWAEFLQANRCITVISKTPIEAVEFSFSGCTLLRPHHVVTLACLIEEYYSLYDIKVLFKIDPDNEACKYLKGIMFFE